MPSLLALCEARTQRFLMLLEGATSAPRNCTVQLCTRVSMLPWKESRVQARLALTGQAEAGVFQRFTLTWRLLRTSEVLASRSCQAELPLDSPKPANSRLQTAKGVSRQERIAGS